MEREDIERLVRVEEGLEVVQSDIRELRTEGKDRADELKAMITKLGLSINESNALKGRVDGLEARMDASNEGELKGMIVNLGAQIDASKFAWSKVLTAENLKIIGYVILCLGGLAGAAQALLP